MRAYPGFRGNKVRRYNSHTTGSMKLSHTLLEPAPAKVGVKTLASGTIAFSLIPNPGAFPVGEMPGFQRNGAWEELVIPNAIAMRVRAFPMFCCQWSDVSYLAGIHRNEG